jgi:phosphatidyl-myo-inositol alpha-mannosyltransferase
VRILHIDPDDVDNPMSGGGPERTLRIYSRLAARHQITVLTPTFHGSTPEKFRNGVRYVRLGRKVGNHGSSHHITFFFALPRAIQRFEYDLLVEDFMPPASATLTPLFTRKPHIASVQWFSAESLSRQYKLPFFLGERFGIRLYRHFVVLTEDMRRRIERRHPAANCACLPNGVAEDLYQGAIRPGEFVLFLGLVDLRIKGVDLLLRAFARIPASERIPLILAGHGFQWDEVKELIRELGLADWVTVVGRVDAAQRRHLFQACRFVCVPSREETFGLVIAEGCAAGKPVVAFDRAPMNEVASPEGCELTPAFDIGGYSDGIRRLLGATPDELVRRGTAGRAWARRFSWDLVAQRQEAFYEDVVAAEAR